MNKEELDRIDELTKQIDTYAIIVAELATKLITNSKEYKVRYLAALTKYAALKTKHILSVNEKNIDTKDIRELESLSDCVQEKDASVVSIFDFANFLKGLEEKAINTLDDDKLTH